MNWDRVTPLPQHSEVTLGGHAYTVTHDGDIVRKVTRTIVTRRKQTRSIEVFFDERNAVIAAWQAQRESST